MELNPLTKMSVVALLCAVGFVGTSHAAAHGTHVAVSPMPFNAGQEVTIKATNPSGPFVDATALVSVRAGDQIVKEWQVHKGPLARGEQFTTPWTPPADLHAKGLQVDVTFVEGAEHYVGEPLPDTSLKLVARCSDGGKAGRPCRYATGRYWIQSTKAPVN